MIETGNAKSIETKPRDTKTRILDAAEKLFAQNGFDATSLRDITAEAQVNLAAVNYHFQSKDSLIDAIIQRHIEPVTQKRLAMLDAAGPDPTLEQIVEAFVAPVLQGDLTAVAPLVGRIFSTPDQFVDRVFNKHLQKIAQRFREAIAKAVPHLPVDEQMWRLVFMGGSMAHLLMWAQVLPVVTNGVCSLADRKAAIARLVNFLAGGFRAPMPFLEIAEKT